MKTLFVVLPQCIEKVLEATAQIALAASEELGEYLQLISNSAPYGWGMYFENNNPQEKRSELAYIMSAVESMSRADYVAFAPEWQEYKECRILHDIAEQYELDIVECDAPEPELKPCLFCGEKDIKIRCFAMSEPGTQFFALCEKCKAGGPVSGSEQGAVEAWNRCGEEHD